MVDLHCHCDQFSLFPNLARARKKRDRAVPDDIDPPHETWPACRVEIENEAVRKRWEWRRKGSTKQRENEVKGAWNSVRHALVQKTCTVRLPDLRHDLSWSQGIVVLATLKTVDPTSKWVLVEVAIIMQEDKEAGHDTVERP